MGGKLYLCATPIGNLEDLTFRVKNTLEAVDLIAAEDTRNSMKLLNHYQIKTPMTSYHDHNKYDKGYYLIERMKKGEQIALITDAGTPAISDPGEELVKMCYEEGIEVTSLPGASACITALTLSGLSTRRFVFEAFLPAKKKERQQVFEELREETRTILIYEAPHRLKKTLVELYDTLGDRKITLIREITKRYESVMCTTLAKALEYYMENEPKGEFVLALEGKSREKIQEENKEKWEKVSIQEHMEHYEGQGIARKDAMKLVAKDRKLTKRDVYRELL